ncbi:MAG: uracil-DNA glycosylase family protein [Pseudomonadota bacterium]
MSLASLLGDMRACTHCAAELQSGARPVLQAGAGARILIAGQAPGAKVHESGVPFDDRSGDRLRDWMGVSRAEFYDPDKIAIVPMGFCYPGKGPSGDLPPRPECATLWHTRLLARLSKIKLALVIGQYAIAYHLSDRQYDSVTDAVRAWQACLPNRFPLPHPSPRNNRWLRNNPWFENEAVPELQFRIKSILSTT